MNPTWERFFRYVNAFGAFQDYYVREYLNQSTPSVIGWAILTAAHDSKHWRSENHDTDGLEASRSALRFQWVLLLGDYLMLDTCALIMSPSKLVYTSNAVFIKLLVKHQQSYSIRCRKLITHQLCTRSFWQDLQFSCYPYPTKIATTRWQLCHNCHYPFRALIVSLM